MEVFRNAVLELTTSEATVYECPTGTTAIAFMCQVACAATAGTTDVAVRLLDSSEAATMLLGAHSLATKTVKSMLDSGNKLVLEAGDKLLASASAGDALTIVVSILETFEGTATPSEPGADGASAYEIAVTNGFVGTVEEWLTSLVGFDGDSAYAIAVTNGFVGTVEEWLTSLVGVGTDGDSAYVVAVTNGFVGTAGEWLESLVGAAGASAYAVAIADGFAGTVEEWLESLVGAAGASAYAVAVANGFTGTVEEWLESLQGTGSGSGGLTVVTKTVADDGDTLTTLTTVYADTGDGAFSLNLPGAPAQGDHIQIVDAENTFSTNNLTLARNGKNIGGLGEDLVLDLSNVVDLFYLNDTYGWRVDVGGAALTNLLTAPSQPASFSAHRIADQTGVADQVSTKVQFNTTEWDTSGCFSIANYRFTPSVAGKYFIASAIRLVGLVSGKYAELGIYKNGVNYKATNNGSGMTEWGSRQVSAIVDMNGISDYIEINVYHNIGSPASILGNTAFSYFQGFLLAPTLQNMVPYSPTDITSRTSDYPLKAGEVVYRDYVNATSVPLYIAAQEGEYEITIQGDTTVAVTNENSTYLLPNNANTSAGAILISRVYYGIYAIAGGVLSENKAAMTGGVIIKAIMKVTTPTKGKSVIIDAFSKLTGGVISGKYENYWNDTTTIWSSLGTLTFPFAQSGKIVIKRIL